MTKADGKVKVIIITGALGSGKTTILNQILKMAAFANSAVLVNEFGDISVDHFLIDEIEEDIIVLDSGCVCCSIKGDLRDSVIRLLEARMAGDVSFSDYIFIETTGLADPIPIVQLFAGDEVLRQNCVLHSVFATVDAANWVHAAGVQEICERQVAVADVVYISKTDIADAASQRHLMTELERLNPGVRRIESRQGLLEQADYWASRARGRHSRIPPAAKNTGGMPDGHLAGIDSFVIDLEGEIERARFELWVRAIIHAHGTSILRLKGIANIDGRAMVVQSVGPIFHPLEPFDQTAGETVPTRLVCITAGLPENAVLTSFKQVCFPSRPHAPIPEHPTDVTRVTIAKSQENAGYSRGALSKPLIDRLRRILSDALNVNALEPVFFSSAHNPWSLAATQIDCWALLDFCEDPEITAWLRSLLGDDIVLFDSDILSPQALWPGFSDTQLVSDDPEIIAVEPLEGVTIRFHFGGDVVGMPLSKNTKAPPPVTLQDGDVIAVPLKHGWAYERTQRDWFGIAVRYMSAHSHFIRDPLHRAHQTRMGKRPLSNLATSPLWLVSGEDRGDNNFATGFQKPQAQWIAAAG